MSRRVSGGFTERRPTAVSTGRDAASQLSSRRESTRRGSSLGVSGGKRGSRAAVGAISPSRWARDTFLSDVIKQTGRSDEKYSAVEKGVTAIDLCGGMAVEKVETLFISGNLLRALNGIDQFPALRVVSVASNYLSSFESVAPLAGLPKLETLSLQNNPVNQLPYYRLHILAMCPSLAVLDNRKVTRKEQASVTEVLSREQDTLTDLYCQYILSTKLDHAVSTVSLHMEAFDGMRRNPPSVLSVEMMIIGSATLLVWYSPFKEVVPAFRKQARRSRLSRMASAATASDRDMDSVSAWDDAYRTLAINLQLNISERLTDLQKVLSARHGAALPDFDEFAFTTAFKDVVLNLERKNEAGKLLKEWTLLGRGLTMKGTSSPKQVRKRTSRAKAVKAEGYELDDMSDVDVRLHYKIGERQAYAKEDWKRTETRRGSVDVFQGTSETHIEERRVSKVTSAGYALSEYRFVATPDRLPAQQVEPATPEDDSLAGILRDTSGVRKSRESGLYASDELAAGTAHASNYTPTTTAVPTEPHAAPVTRTLSSPSRQSTTTRRSLIESTPPKKVRQVAAHQRHIDRLAAKRSGVAHTSPQKPGVARAGKTVQSTGEVLEPGVGVKRPDIPATDAPDSATDEEDSLLHAVRAIQGLAPSNVSDDPPLPYPAPTGQPEASKPGAAQKGGYLEAYRANQQQQKTHAPKLPRTGSGARETPAPLPPGDDTHEDDGDAHPAAPNLPEFPGENPLAKLAKPEPDTVTEAYLGGTKAQPPQLDTSDECMLQEVNMALREKLMEYQKANTKNAAAAKQYKAALKEAQADVQAKQAEHERILTRLSAADAAAAEADAGAALRAVEALQAERAQLHLEAGSRTAENDRLRAELDAAEARVRALEKDVDFLRTKAAEAAFLRDTTPPPRPAPADGETRCFYCDASEAWVERWTTLPPAVQTRVVGLQRRVLLRRGLMGLATGVKRAKREKAASAALQAFEARFWLRKLVREWRKRTERKRYIDEGQAMWTLLTLRDRFARWSTFAQTNHAAAFAGQQGRWIVWEQAARNKAHPRSNSSGAESVTPQARHATPLPMQGGVQRFTDVDPTLGAQSVSFTGHVMRSQTSGEPFETDVFSPVEGSIGWDGEPQIARRAEAGSSFVQRSRQQVAGLPMDDDLKERVHIATALMRALRSGAAEQNSLVSTPGRPADGATSANRPQGMRWRGSEGSDMREKKQATRRQDRFGRLSLHDTVPAGNPFFAHPQNHHHHPVTLTPNPAEPHRAVPEKEPHATIAQCTSPSGHAKPASRTPLAPLQNPRRTATPHFPIFQPEATTATPTQHIHLVPKTKSSPDDRSVQELRGKSAFVKPSDPQTRHKNQPASAKTHHRPAIDTEEDEEDEEADDGRQYLPPTETQLMSPASDHASAKGTRCRQKQQQGNLADAPSFASGKNPLAHLPRRHPTEPQWHQDPASHRNGATPNTGFAQDPFKPTRHHPDQQDTIRSSWNAVSTPDAFPTHPPSTAGMRPSFTEEQAHPHTEDYRLEKLVFDAVRSAMAGNPPATSEHQSWNAQPGQRPELETVLRGIFGLKDGDPSTHLPAGDCASLADSVRHALLESGASPALGRQVAELLTRGGSMRVDSGPGAVPRQTHQLTRGISDLHDRVQHLLSASVPPLSGDEKNNVLGLLAQLSPQLPNFADMEDRADGFRCKREGRTLKGALRWWRQAAGTRYQLREAEQRVVHRTMRSLVRSVFGKWKAASIASLIKHKEDKQKLATELQEHKQKVTHLGLSNMKLVDSLSEAVNKTATLEVALESRGSALADLTKVLRNCQASRDAMQSRVKCVENVSADARLKMKVMEREVQEVDRQVTEQHAKQLLVERTACKQIGLLAGDLDDAQGQLSGLKKQLHVTRQQLHQAQENGTSTAANMLEITKELRQTLRLRDRALSDLDLERMQQETAQEALGKELVSAHVKIVEGHNERASLMEQQQQRIHTLKQQVVHTEKALNLQNAETAEKDLEVRRLTHEVRLMEQRERRPASSSAQYAGMSSPVMSTRDRGARDVDSGKGLQPPLFSHESSGEVEELLKQARYAKQQLAAKEAYLRKEKATTLMRTTIGSATTDVPSSAGGTPRQRISTPRFMSHSVLSPAETEPREFPHTSNTSDAKLTRVTTTTTLTREPDILCGEE
ncbi:U2 small nuclear ribonucleoprotein Aprime [Diplonema papillatum]|nr:U2 small nuclear ribonucleoprotein Aprime [Diplonema papillatum]